MKKLELKWTQSCWSMVPMKQNSTNVPCHTRISICVYRCVCVRLYASMRSNNDDWLPLGLCVRQWQHFRAPLGSIYEHIYEYEWIYVIYSKNHKHIVSHTYICPSSRMLSLDVPLLIIWILYVPIWFVFLLKIVELTLVKIILLSKLKTENMDVESEIFFEIYSASLIKIS